MSESFGARLRQRREERNVALVTIAHQTKIKQSLLAALERDDVSNWPSGIYRRAFIRAYASAIGLDPDVVVREFLEVHPEPPEVDVLEAMAATFNGAHGSARPTTRIRNAVGSAIGSLSWRGRIAAVDDRVVTDGPLNGLKIPAELEAPVVSQAPVPVQLDHMPTPDAEGEQANPATASLRADRPSPREPDLPTVAHVCTEFSRMGTIAELQPLLQEAAGILDATGLIVWVWDASCAHLKPELVHGYSDKVVAQLPTVGRDADNATAAAFRSAEPRVIDASDQANGALVVPLLTPAGCAGVLAIELQRGTELTSSTRAIATILAALLAQMTGSVAATDVPTADRRGRSAVDELTILTATDARQMRAVTGCP